MINFGENDTTFPFFENLRLRYVIMQGTNDLVKNNKNERWYFLMRKKVFINEMMPAMLSFSLIAGMLPAAMSENTAYG